MTPTRMVFTKWGGLPHWEYDAVRLGEDEHGLWLGTPLGTLVGRPEARFHTDVHQVVLVPEAGFVATFFAPGGRAPCDLYVDITTVSTARQQCQAAADRHAVSLDSSGADRVRGDPELRSFLRNRARERNDPGFGRAVVALADRALEGVAGKIDDAPKAFPAHVLDRVVRHVPVPFEVHRHHRVEVLRVPDGKEQEAQLLTARDRKLAKAVLREPHRVGKADEDHVF